MKVGTICKLKVACLSEEAGTLGVVFYDYDDGFQVIFEHGNYDGFSTQHRMGGSGRNPMMDMSEAEAFLEEVGFEESLAGYQFKNVLQVSEDYRQGKFDRAWSIFWQKAAEQIEQAEAKAESELYEYEKCKVYADGNRLRLLRFKRNIGEDTVRCCFLSAAMDFADFAWFEYVDHGKSLFPRLLQAGKETLYPQFVVFHKKN